MNTNRLTLYKSLLIILLGLSTSLTVFYTNSYIKSHDMPLLYELSPFIEGVIIYNLISLILRKWIPGNIYKSHEFYLFMSLFVGVYFSIAYMI